MAYQEQNFENVKVLEADQINHAEPNIQNEQEAK